jgi:hypothetical protein
VIVRLVEEKQHGQDDPLASFELRMFKACTTVHYIGLGNAIAAPSRALRGPLALTLARRGGKLP